MNLGCLSIYIYILPELIMISQVRFALPESIKPTKTYKNIGLVRCFLIAGFLAYETLAFGHSKRAQVIL